MNTKFLFLIAITATAITASPSDCLKSLAVKAHYKGEKLPAVSAQEIESLNAAIKNFISFDSITQKKITACNPTLTQAFASCEAKNGKGNCEKINAVTVAKKCPKGFVRGSDNICSVACPKGYREMGNYCEKPKGYVLRPFKSLEECMRKTKSTCTIWHVRYYAGVCKKNFEKLGSTVCVGKCPYGTEDHDSFCLKSAKVNAGEKFFYELSHN